VARSVARDQLGPALPLAIGAALTIPFLGSRSFWLDEGLSFTLSRLEWSEFTHTVAERENNMVLYHLLLRGWTELGTSEAFVRGLSVIAGLTALLVFCRLALRLFGARVAFAAGLLLATNPIFVHYSREARGYAVCLALVTAASYLFVRGLSRPSWAVWIGYAVLSAAAVYTHLFAVLVPAAHAASLLFFTERRLPWRRLGASAALLAVGLVPFAALSSAAGSSGIEWAAENAPGRVFVRLQEQVPALVAVALVALVGAAALLLSWRIRQSALGRRPGTWPWAFVLSWFVVPFALVVLISFFATPVFVVRYFIVVVPALVLVLALALAQIRRPGTYAAALAAAVVASTAFTLTWSPGAEERWEDATRYIAAEAASGDGVLFFAPYARVPFEVYLDELPRGKATLRPVYPESPWGGELLTIIEDVPITEQNVAAATSAYLRLWLVLSHEEFEDPAEHAALLRALDSRFRSESEHGFAEVSVMLYERRST
jgi:4-amino-4-deoxy-L-arabinose transferase-like glycosyltransferase